MGWTVEGKMVETSDGSNTVAEVVLFVAYRVTPAGFNTIKSQHLKLLANSLLVIDVKCVPNTVCEGSFHVVVCIVVKFN